MAERRAWQNACVWQRDRNITYMFCRDLHLTLMFSGLSQKHLFKGRWSLKQICFKQNYCHPCHTRFVWHLLCSFVLRHKFTFDTSKPKNTALSKFQYKSGTTPQKIMPQCVWEKKTSKKYSATSETTVKEISNIIIIIETPMRYQVSFRAKTSYPHTWKYYCYFHMWKDYWRWSPLGLEMLISSVFQIYLSGVIYEMWTSTNNPGCPLCKKMLWFLLAF